jgi:hypothetical protein
MSLSDIWAGVGAILFGILVFGAIRRFYRDARSFRVMASFRGTVPADPEHDSPEGHYLVRKLLAALATVSADKPDFDNWNDIGWFVTCRIGGEPLVISFGLHEPGTSWQLSIESHAKGPSRYSPAMRELTAHVNRILQMEPSLSELQWSLTGNPQKSGIADPTQLHWPHS